MKNCGNFSIFLWVAVNELWLTEKKKERKKEEEGQNGYFCGGITRQNERSGELRG